MLGLFWVGSRDRTGPAPPGRLDNLSRDLLLDYVVIDDVIMTPLRG